MHECPVSHLSHWGVRCFWSKGKPPSTWGMVRNALRAARAASSVIPAHTAPHVHPFRLAKASVQGLFTDAAKVNGAADLSGAAIEAPHSRVLG